MSEQETHANNSSQLREGEYPGRFQDKEVAHALAVMGNDTTTKSEQTHGQSLGNRDPEVAGSLSPREAADWSGALKREYEAHVDERDEADTTAEEAFLAADEEDTADAFKEAHEIARRVAPDVYLGRLGMKKSLKEGKELAEKHGEALYDAAVAEAALDSIVIKK